MISAVDICEVCPAEDDGAPYACNILEHDRADP